MSLKLIQPQSYALTCFTVRMQVRAKDNILISDQTSLRRAPPPPPSSRVPCLRKKELLKKGQCGGGAAKPKLVTKQRSGLFFCGRDDSLPLLLFCHHHSSLAHGKLHPRHRCSSWSPILRARGGGLYSQTPYLSTYDPRDPACIYYQQHTHSPVLYAQAEEEWASASASPLPSSPFSYFPSFLAPSAAAMLESGSAPRRPRAAARGFGTSRTASTSSRKWWRTRSE